MDAPTPDDALIDRVVQVSRKLRKVFDARASTHGLTTARAILLRYLSRHEGATQSELAAALDVEQPSMIGLIDGLEKTGWVTRKAVPGDRRAKGIHLTERAREETAEISAFTEALRTQMMQGLDTNEILTAMKVLDNIMANIESCRGHGDFGTDGDESKPICMKLSDV